jgi:hypothetical protein
MIQAGSSNSGQGMSPLIRPRGNQGQSLIPIESRVAGVAKSGSAGHTDPYAFWMKYYLTNDEKKIKPDRQGRHPLRETVALLNLSGKTRDVHAALLAYLTRHPREAEAWMYEALAISIEMNHGSPADLKTALNYAADLAQKGHNPNFLVSVADIMYRKGVFDRVGPLLDEATEKVPHRSEPLAMSINLAQKTKDPRRMGDSIDRLLSLGWPGQDEYFRTEARNQAETLAKKLREDGRGPEADALLARLTNAESRDLFVRLTWDGQADFDLKIEEPLGATASYDMPRTVFGGSLLKNGYGTRPEEVYVCPRGFDGDYTVRIDTIWIDPTKPVTRLTLETIAHEGTSVEQKKTYNLAPDKLDKPLVVRLSEGRRKKVLPFVDPAATMDEVDAQLTKNARPKKRTRAPLAHPPGGDPKSRQSSKDAAKPMF